MKPRLKDVAKLAGVGIATVDRVVNERGNVSARTANKIIEAAQTLGIGRTLPAPHRKIFRLGVVMPERTTPLLARLSDAFERQIALTKKSLLIERRLFHDTKVEAIPDYIAQTTCDALIVFARETSAVVEAIARATSSGRPVVTLGSDLPTTPRLAYVGIDHYRAGRTAAYFVARMAKPGRFVVVSDDIRYRAEALRISGFRDGLRAEVGGQVDLEILEGLGSAGVRARSCDGVTGVYVCAASQATLKAVRHWTLDRPVIVGHDLGAQVREMLDDGTMAVVIDQNPEAQAERAVALAQSWLNSRTQIESSGTVPFTLHTRDNA